MIFSSGTGKYKHVPTGKTLPNTKTQKNINRLHQGLHTEQKK